MRCLRPKKCFVSIVILGPLGIGIKFCYIICTTFCYMFMYNFLLHVCTLVYPDKILSCLCHPLGLDSFCTYLNCTQLCFWAQVSNLIPTQGHNHTQEQDVQCDVEPKKNMGFHVIPSLLEGCTDGYVIMTPRDDMPWLVELIGHVLYSNSNFNSFGFCFQSTLLVRLLTWSRDLSLNFLLISCVCSTSGLVNPAIFKPDKSSWNRPSYCVGAYVRKRLFKYWGQWINTTHGTLFI